jgi:26S proteasome regulatory subunit N2
MQVAVVVDQWGVSVRGVGFRCRWVSVSLGFGVTGMGGKNPKAFDDLRQALFTDSTIVGEAAMYAILLGTAGAASAKEMLTYARETQYEKIIRVLAVGVGFIYYGRRKKRTR